VTITIEKELVEQMIQTSIAYNDVMSKLLASLQTDQWLTPAEAEKVTGIPSQKIRHLARSGQIESRKKSQKLIEVLLSDLKKEASNRA
jgi:hypothetical protein